LTTLPLALVENGADREDLVNNFNATPEPVFVKEVEPPALLDLPNKNEPPVAP
jgi:hypothetical protein